MDDTTRCGLLARASEPLPGTAPEAGTWLLVEDHGPWGRDALQDGTLPEALVARFAADTETHGVRYQAIRRPDRTRRPTRAAFLANVRAGWLARWDLPVEDLGDLDVGAVTAHRPPAGATTVTDPLVAVCTHGRRDACCAQWGRPLVTALADLGGDAVWETSHTGGHRFAPSVLTFPSGAIHGFVDDVEVFWNRVAANRLDLASYRGNAGLDHPAQAAEVAVRQRLDLTDPADVDGVDLAVLGDAAEARVRHRGLDGTWTESTVTLSRTRLPDGPTSCEGDPKPRATWVPTLT